MSFSPHWHSSFAFDLVFGFSLGERKTEHLQRKRSAALPGAKANFDRHPVSSVNIDNERE